MNTGIWGFEFSRMSEASLPSDGRFLFIVLSHLFRVGTYSSTADPTNISVNSRSTK